MSFNSLRRFRTLLISQKVVDGGGGNGGNAGKGGVDECGPIFIGAIGFIELAEIINIITSRKNCDFILINNWINPFSYDD